MFANQNTTSGAQASSSMALATVSKLATEPEQLSPATGGTNHASSQPLAPLNQYKLSSRAQARRNPAPTLAPISASVSASKPSLMSLLMVSLALSCLLAPLNDTSRLFVSSRSVPVQASSQAQQLLPGNVADKLIGAERDESHVIKPGQQRPFKLALNWTDLDPSTTQQSESKLTRTAPAATSTTTANSNMMSAVTTTTEAGTRQPAGHIMPWNESIWWLFDQVLDGGGNYIFLPTGQQQQQDSISADEIGGQQDATEEIEEAAEEGDDDEIDKAGDSLVDEIERDNSTSPSVGEAPVYARLAEPESVTASRVQPATKSSPLVESNRSDDTIARLSTGESSGSASGGSIDSSRQSNGPQEMGSKLSSGGQPTRFGRALAPTSNQFPPFEEFSTIDTPQKAADLQQQQPSEHQLVNGDESDNNGGGAGDDNGESAITCSPDDDFQTIMVDQASANEVFNGPGGSGPSAGNSLNNLTKEQRQQLINEAGASGLLSSSSGGGGVRGQSDLGVGQQSGTDEEIDEQLKEHLSQQYRSQTQPGQGSGQMIGVGTCVPKGLKMIEMITGKITPILFSIIIVVGLLGNIIVMLVILEDRKLERELTPTNLLILDLSLADLSFIILCIPFTGWDYAVGHWVFGSLWCKFNQYLIVACALSSIYTLVLMSIDRFMAIVYPIKCLSYRTSRNMLHAIVIKWIVILVAASPTALMHGLIDSPRGPGLYSCRFLSDQYNPLHFQIVFFVTSYLFPLILIFCLYLSLLNKLWYGQKPQGHKESHKMLESKKRVTWLVASIVIVFAICWFPIQIMLILMRLKQPIFKYTATYVAVQVFAHTLGYMNSCVNPIVYAFASETFNQSFKKSWLGRWCLCHFGNSSHYYNNPTNGLSNSHNSHFFAERTGSAGGGIGMLTSTTALDSRKSARNSLQVIPMSNSNNKNQFGVSPRNKSLNNIFSSPAEASASLIQTTTTTTNKPQPQVKPLESNPDDARESQAGSPTPPKLEPRDRYQVPQPAVHKSPSPSPTPTPSPTTSQSFAQNAVSAAATDSAGSKLSEQQQQQSQIDVSLSVQKQQQQQQQLVPRQPTSSPKVFQSLQKQQLVARMVNNQSNGNQVVAHQCEPCNDF